MPEEGAGAAGDAGAHASHGLSGLQGILHVAGATAANQRLIPSWAFESGDLNPNPIPTKAMMKVLGLPGGDCRPPMGPEPDDLQDLARRILVGLGRG